MVLPIRISLEQNKDCRKAYSYYNLFLTFVIYYGGSMKKFMLSAGIAFICLIAVTVYGGPGGVMGKGTLKMKKAGFSVMVSKVNMYQIMSDHDVEITIYDTGDPIALSITKFAEIQKWDAAVKMFKTDLGRILLTGQGFDPIPAVSAEEYKKIKKLNKMPCLIMTYTFEGYKGVAGIFKTKKGIYQFNSVSAAGGFPLSIKPVMKVINSIKPI